MMQFAQAVPDSPEELIGTVLLMVISWFLARRRKDSGGVTN